MATASIIFDLIGRDRASDKIDKVGNTANDSGGKLDKFGKAGKLAGAGIAAGMAAAAAGILVTGKALLSAMDNEKILDRQAAALGASTGMAQKYGKVSSQLYAGAWGESLDEVAHAVEAVGTSFKGLSSAGDLKKVSAQAMDFATIFEVDIPDAVSKASTIVNSGLVSSASEAFDLLTASSQRIPAALRGDLLDAGEEYSQFFKAVGLSGEQAFGILVEGAKKGQYGLDKAGDAVKEFTIRSTDGSKASTDAFNAIGLDATKMSNDILAGGDRAGGAFAKVVDGLLAIKDPSTRAQQAIALFGTPLEDLGVNGIPTFLRSLQQGSKGLDGWKGSIDAAGKTLNDNASTNLESFKRQISTTFVTFIGGKALPALSRFSAFLATNVGPAISKMQPYLRQFGDYLGTKLPPILTGLTEIFRNAVSIISSIWRTFGSTIVDFLRSSFQNTVTILNGAFTVIRGIFQTVSALLKGDWKGVWDGIKTIIRGAARIVIGVVRELWNRIRTAFRIGATLLKNMVRTTFSGIGALARAGVSLVVTQVRALPGRLKALGGLMLSAGKSLIGKLWEGIKNAAGNAGGFVGDLVSKIKSGINNMLNLPLKFKMPKLMGGATLTIIPAFANGTNFAPGGVALVGERGPELVDLPRGSKVTPNGASMARLAGGGGGDVLHVHFHGIADSVSAGREVEKVLIRYGLATGRPLQVKTI